MSLTDVPVRSLLPGYWVDRAQHVLDVMSELRAPDEVAERFGTARAVGEAVLGLPVTGGHCTKPVVRALGRLLHHRLGPAVAAEALSWAAAVADVVDSTTIEALLTMAAGADVTLRPLQLNDRFWLVERLDRHRAPAARRKSCCRCGRSTANRPTRAATNPSSRLSEDRRPYSDPYHREDEPSGHEWLDELLSGRTPPREYMPGRRLRSRLEAATDPEARRAILDGASYTAMSQLAQQPDLFELPLDAIEYCLLEFTSSFLANPECPPGLERRIRAPHDVASLELRPGRVGLLLAPACGQHAAAARRRDARPVRRHHPNNVCSCAPTVPPTAGRHPPQPAGRSRPVRRCDLCRSAPRVRLPAPRLRRRPRRSVHP